MCSQLEPIVKKDSFFFLVGKVDKLRWRDDTSIFWVFLFGRNKNCHPQPPTGSIPPVHLNRFKFSFCVCPLHTYNFYPDGTITLCLLRPYVQHPRVQVPRSYVSVTSGHARSITSEPQLLRLFLFSFSFSWFDM